MEEQMMKILLEMQGNMKGIHGQLDGINQRLDGIDQRFDGIDQRLDGIDQRLENLETRTTKIEVTLENETNTNIKLLMEQSNGLFDKTKHYDLACDTLDDVKSTVSVIWNVVKQHSNEIRDIQKVI